MFKFLLKMKKGLLVIGVILIVIEFGYSQKGNVEILTIRPKMDRFIYENLTGALNEANKKIKDSSDYWFYMGMHYWNKYLAYANLSNSDTSKMHWIKGYNMYPYYFCDHLKNHTKIKSIDTMTTYYYLNLFQNHTFYDSCCKVYYNSLDSALIRELKQIEKDDQYYRNKIEEIGYPSKIKEYWEYQNIVDSINLIKIDSIISIFGYPGRDKVGVDNEKIIFLVIQHSNLESMYKYLPDIKKEVQNHNLNPNIYAYLVDRISLLKDEPQIFGTQVIEKGNDKWGLYKMKSFYKIDSLRESFNLGKLSYYLKQYNIELNK